MHAHHPSRRARMRAHSLLLSHQRYPIPQIARLYQVDPRRVSAWMVRWQAWGLVGLYDRPRSGRPAIFTAALVPCDVMRLMSNISGRYGCRGS
jgi:hypothetical protein